jgi:hypothetical protein
LLQLLLAANDFIGISGYGSGYRLKQLSWRDMEIPLQTLAYELNFFGINLKEYTSKKPVLYVEQVGTIAAAAHVKHLHQKTPGTGYTLCACMYTAPAKSL